MRWRVVAIVLAISALSIGCGSEGPAGVDGSQGPEGPQGPAGDEGTSCTVDEQDGAAVITCEDGTEASISAEGGEGCTIADDGDATVLTCGDEEVALSEGSSCQVESAEGAIHIHCDDGTNATVGEAVEVAPTLTRIAGEQTGGYSDGPASRVRIDGPMEMALSSDGKFLYFTDAFNLNIRRYGIHSDEVTTLAGAPGLAGIDDGIGSEAQFEGPRSLAVDPDGEYLYIADGFSCTIRRLDLSTREVDTYAGQAEFCDAVDGPVGNARFQLTMGMIVDDDGRYLYLSDRGNDAIRRIDLEDDEVETIAGQLGASGMEDGPGADALFDSPGGLTFDESGDYLYVADMGNDVIRRISVAEGEEFETTTVAGDSYDGFLDELVDGVGDDARFSTPQAVERVGDKLVVVGFSGVIRVVTPDASGYEVETVAGEYLDRSFVDGSFEDARFGVGFGLTAASDGQRFFFGDRGHDAIRVVDLEEQTVETSIGATPDLYGYRSGPVDEALFDSPAGVAATADGQATFVADRHNDVIRVVNGDTGYAELLAGIPGVSGYADGIFDAAQFDSPYGLALTEDETGLFVTETGNHVIRHIDLATREVTTVAGDPFTDDEFGDGAVDEAAFFAPTDVAVTAAGDELFVADSVNARIRHVDLDDGTVTTLAGGNDDEEADPDATGEDAVFLDPVGIALTPDEETLYVTDGSGGFFGPEHNAIRRVDIASGEVTTLSGMEGDGSVDQNDTVALDDAVFDSPEHIAVDDSGQKLFVADTWHHAIRVIDLTNEEVSVAVGTVGRSAPLYSPVVPLEQARLERPVGVAISGDYSLRLTFDNALYEAHNGGEGW